MGAPQAKNFHFPPVGAPQAREFSLFPPWGLPKLGPPPPSAKADIATAILTNVIEHLVLLLPPNKHAFTAKAVWADLGLVQGEIWVSPGFA